MAFGTMVGETRSQAVRRGKSSASPSPARWSRTRRSCLLDEATSALDTRTEQEILGTLKRLEEGRTTIAIAHPPVDHRRCGQYSRAPIMDGWPKVAPMLRCLAKGGLYAEMWSRQSVASGARASARKPPKPPK